MSGIVVLPAFAVYHWLAGSSDLLAALILLCFFIAYVPIHCQLMVHRIEAGTKDLPMLVLSFFADMPILALKVFQEVCKFNFKFK